MNCLNSGRQIYQPFSLCLLHQQLVYASDLTMEGVREYETKMNKQTNDKVGTQNPEEALDDTSASEATKDVNNASKDESPAKIDLVN